MNFDKFQKKKNGYADALNEENAIYSARKCEK